MIVMKHGYTLQLVLLLSLSLGSGGCVTKRLWEDDPLVRMREPARPVELELFKSQQNTDVLVCYQEVKEGSDELQWRAYWLKPILGAPRNPHQPKFISVVATNGLTVVPIFVEMPTAWSGSNWFAVLKTNPPGFVLYSGQQPLAVHEHELPVYPGQFGKAAQAFLTPPAAVVDLAVCSAVIAGYVGLFVWSQFPNTDPH